ncbi:MAG TPA: response regulator transcription factor [Terriglobales bacterium]|nr:response regulator transcription factor [Terriglobales bacterium]
MSFLPLKLHVSTVLESAPNPHLRTRVLVADAVAMSCQLLVDALLLSKRYDAVAAMTPEEVVLSLDRDRFHVMLIGTSFSKDPVEGLRFVSEVRQLHREVGIVVLLDSMERNLVVEAFRCGAQGVFARSDSFQTLCKCISCVQEGQVWASSAELGFVLEALVDPLPIQTRGLPSSRPLSKREEEIARMVAEGFSNRQISERLDLSEHTIKNYLFRVFEKLGVSTRVELTLYALKRGKVPRTRPQAANTLPKAEPRLVGREN